MSAPIGPAYSISRSIGVCAATGQRFAQGDRYLAVLAERPGQDALERLDFSEAAWRGGARPPSPLAVFATWRAVYVPPEAKKKLALGDDELLDLFEQLATATSPKQVAFRYVLALLLVRRRVLALAGQRGDTLTVHARRPASDLSPPHTYEVNDPKLDAETLQSVIEQFGEIVGEPDAQPTGPDATHARSPA